MRTGALAVAIVLVLTAGRSPAAAQTPGTKPETDKPGAVRGRVTAADTGRPMRRARITLRSATDAGARPAISANTNSLGRFEAKNVPPGPYIVTVTAPWYLSAEYGQRRAGERGVTVSVGAGAVVNDIDVALQRAGVIAGRISDELGEPFPGVRVDALALRYVNGRRVPSPFNVATTDDLGEFRIPALPAGRYYIVASTTETWRTPKNETFGYPSTYYPGGSIQTAQAITLAPSERRSDISLQLPSTRTVRITGRLQRENGEPIGGTNVPLAYSYPGAGLMVAGMRNVRTQPDGSFEFKDVAGGVYSIGGGSAEQILTIADADVENLLLVAKTGSTVLGTIVTDDGTPPPFSSSGVRVLLVAPFGKTLPTVYGNSVDADWSFKLTNLGGPFMFRVGGLPPEWTLESVRLGDKDISDIPWDAPTGGKEISGLRIVVSQKIGRISGTLLDASGRATPLATIVVFSEDADHWIPGSRFIKTVRPGTDGRFAIRDLPPGTYRAIARDTLEEGQWEDPAFLEQVRDDGVRIVLADGGSESVALRLPAAR